MISYDPKDLHRCSQPIVTIDHGVLVEALDGGIAPISGWSHYSPNFLLSLQFMFSFLPPFYGPFSFQSDLCSFLSLPLLFFSIIDAEQRPQQKKGEDDGHIRVTWLSFSPLHFTPKLKNFWEWHLWYFIKFSLSIDSNIIMLSNKDKRLDLFANFLKFWGLFEIFKVLKFKNKRVKVQRVSLNFF